MIETIIDGVVNGIMNAVYKYMDEHDCYTLSSSQIEKVLNTYFREEEGK